MPKKCGHTPGRRVIPAEEMALKIKVAVEARRRPGLPLVARTDARTAHGLDEAIRRGRLYAEGRRRRGLHREPGDRGRDERIGQEIDAPLLANNVDGAVARRSCPPRSWPSYGYNVAIYPAVGFLTAAAALERSYAHL